MFIAPVLCGIRQLNLKGHTMATININGELILDQTAGLQDDDVEVTNTANTLGGALDSQFLDYLNSLTLSNAQRGFAAKVEGASDANLVTVTPAPGETIGRLFFSDSSGNDFDGDLVQGVTTLGGGALYLWSALNSKVVLVSTSNVSPTASTLVAAFYIEATNTANTAAKVESITFASLLHPDSTDPDDSVDFSDVLRVAAVVTQSVGDDIVVDDDGPVVTLASSAGTAATAAHLGNAVGQSVNGGFGYDIGADEHDALFYTNGGSDFVNMALTGSVEGPPATNIISPSVTLASEDASTATFNWSFTYDVDPLTAGVQTGTAAGTLTFNKVADTFSIGVTDAVEGFSLSVLHSSELLRKAPPGNTGHPEIVVTELDLNNGTTDTNGFYVQFTANSNPSGSPFGFNGTGDGAPIAGDTTFNAGQMISSSFEDWVSATQSTNGVAGDTIQKGELLTLRFFNQNILGDVVPGAPGGGTENLTETDHVSGLALKFDGIGNSEDLILVLDLIDTTNSSNTTTKSIFVQNADMIKGAVPAPYNTEFSLDNNDALVVIEANDYNLAAGEHWEIQGVQIMQSGNGLTGTAINLNGAVGANGGSANNGTQAWEATDNDVLKIVDIGFIETNSGFQDAALNFSFDVADADLDLMGVQHIHALISNDFIV